MPDTTYSLSKALREMLDRGSLTGLERNAHFMLLREAESTEHAWMHTNTGRDLALHVPIELFTRQISTQTFPIGTRTDGVSNLQTWSACLRAGATVLTGLSRNANLWEIGQLPVATNPSSK